MGWRDRIQPAKFGGVQMFVTATTRTHGRRVPVRRLAGQDESVQQDLGLEPTEYEIIAYYWGPSYDQQRDALEAELVKPGAVTVTLPFRGDLKARVTSGPITNESKDELGYCTIRFSIVVEPGTSGGGKAAGKAAGGLTAKADTAATLKKAAGSAQAAAAAATAAKTNARGLPSVSVKSTIKAIQKVTTALKKVQASVQSQMAVIDDFSSAITELDATANSILSTPSTLATKLTGAVLSVVGLPATVERNLSDTASLLSSSPTTVASQGGRTSAGPITDRQAGRIGTTPFDRATSARETMKAVKLFASLNAGESTSAGVSVARGTLPPAAATRVDSGTVGVAASSVLAASGGKTVSAAFRSGSSSSSTTEGAATALVEEALYPIGGEPVRSRLTVSDQETVNTRVIYEMAKTLAVAAAAETFSSSEFDSSTLALAALELMSDTIDDIQAYTVSDTVCAVLGELRGALAEHLTAVASQLPATFTFQPSGIVSISEGSNQGMATISIGQTTESLDATKRSGPSRSGGLSSVVRYAPPREVPAVLIAQDIYGDATLELDLIARNRLRHPLFVGEPIEIISPG